MEREAAIEDDFHQIEDQPTLLLRQVYDVTVSDVPFKGFTKSELQL